MTILCKDSYLSRIARSLYAGDITLGIQRHVDFTSLMTLDIIAPHANLRVNLSWYGILISIVTRIFGKLSALWFQALKQLHRVLLNRTLIVTDPDNLFRISREHHR